MPVVWMTEAGAVHQGNSRSAWSAVQKTTDDMFICASGKVSGPGASVSGKACGAKNSVQAFNRGA